MLTVGSLFSGIGGIDLGLERAGMKVLWQVEIDEWCRAVLAKHWPDVERHADVRECGGRNLRSVDLICGGFPCQDISQAGRGGGLEGARSGLWFEFARIIRDLRPRYVLVENVPLLKSRGLDRLLGNLAESGYDAEWDCIPAAAVGAPHQRDRIWIIGHRQDGERPNPNVLGSHRAIDEADDTGPLALDRPAAVRPFLADASERGAPSAISDAERVELWDQRQRIEAPERRDEGPAVTDDDGSEGLVADADAPVRGRASRLGRWSSSASDAAPQHDGDRGEADGQWSSEPNVGRVAHGVPNRVDRLRGLGNAVVPQVVEWIGRRIVEAEAQSGVS